jgi:mycothiol synthase
MARDKGMEQGLPEGYAIRAPTVDDFRAVADLILACDVASFGEPDYTERELLADWQDLDLEANARVVVAPGGALAGYAAVEDRGHGTIDAEGYIHPSHAGRGLGTYLIWLTEARAREHTGCVAPGSHVVVDNTINGEDGPVRRLLEREGYGPVRHFWRMAIELDEPPLEPELPEGLAIRPCVPGEDELPIFEALDEALRDHWEHPSTTFEHWERRKKRMGFDPGLWLLAVDGGEVAGAAVCADHPDSGWVSELAVRRPWRRRGLGLALLRCAFAQFYNRGRRKVALAVDSQSLTGATRLYEKAGMRVERLYSVYRKELRTARRPD